MARAWKCWDCSKFQRADSVPFAFRSLIHLGKSLYVGSCCVERARNDSSLQEIARPDPQHNELKEQ